MKTKAEMFWEKVDLLIRQRKTTLKEFCRRHDIVYGTVMSNKSRMILPSIDIAANFARGLNVSIDDLVSEDIIFNKEERELDRVLDDLKQKEEKRNTDPLYDLLDESSDLKALVWRIVQCSAIQIRTIKTMLASWGIGEYDSMGNSKAVVSS